MLTEIRDGGFGVSSAHEWIAGNFGPLNSVRVFRCKEGAIWWMSCSSKKRRSTKLECFLIAGIRRDIKLECFRGRSMDSFSGKHNVDGF